MQVMPLDKDFKTPEKQKELNDQGIFYSGGIMGVRIIKRDNSPPLIQFIDVYEDRIILPDNIFHDAFDARWLPGLIENLKAAEQATAGTY